MTEEEARIYSEQIQKSAGFDVGFIPGVNMLGQIFPEFNIEDQRVWHYDLYAQAAVEEYRSRFKDENRELEFVKVLKVMHQVANVFRFYITFEAKDLADGDKIKIYQAVVLLDVEDDIIAKSCRLKPREDQQGNQGKEWLWNDHCCPS